MVEHTANSGQSPAAQEASAGELVKQLPVDGHSGVSRPMGRNAAPEFNPIGTGCDLVASLRYEAGRRGAGTAAGRVLQRQSHRVPASCRDCHAARGTLAYATRPRAPSLLSPRVSPGDIAVTDDDGGIVDIRVRPGRKQHRACCSHIRLRDALPGPAHQQPLPADRGMAHLLAAIRDSGWRIPLPGNGSGQLQRVQSRPTATRLPAMSAGRAAAPASTWRLSRQALPDS